MALIEVEDIDNTPVFSDEDILITKDKSRIKYSQYIPIGMGSILRSALDHDDERHLYHFVKRHNLQPEAYGIEDPYIAMKREEFDEMTRDDLLREILMYRKMGF